ncbi:V-type ATP synthase subunit E [Halobaculum lipolyticum]|uniref:A-type ATP synthase subunit E n=1 Tax=Halobaculum lipolyticum TaxID=3032001 RepID=A0ABD5W742_9EURY|nr:V-type ATP synthase subunit E [Halobaculum sp. DT31]
MSLETVVDDIEDEARARAEEIREAGEERAAEIVAEAEEEADRIVEEREQQVERQIDQEREQTLSAAKLEAKQQRLEARRDVLADVRDRTEAAIADLEGEEREELTRSLLDAAAPEFDDDESVAVHGRADDEELLTEVLADYEGWSFAGERDCLGGVVVESETSRVRVNNTFDSVLEAVWEDNLKELSDRLFEDE